MRLDPDMVFKVVNGTALLSFALLQPKAALS